MVYLLKINCKFKVLFKVELVKIVPQFKWKKLLIY